MTLLTRDFLSRFWKLYSPIRKVRMHLLLGNKKKALVIHTPGKVGSTSVYVTLKKVLANTHNVFHFHFLSPDAIKSRSKENLVSERKSLPLHLIESKHFTEMFDYQNNDIELIVLIREPIGRYISATYQNLNMYFKQGQKTNLKSINDFIFAGFQNDEHLTKLDWWFEEELKSHFKIDVFMDDDLIRKDDYWFFKKDNVKVYIIKMEELNDIFPKFCKKELGMSDVELIDSNVGTNKVYAEKYRQTKKALVIPTDIIKKTKESRFYRRFYENSI